MKVLFILISLFSSSVFATDFKYDVSCKVLKNGDLFKSNSSNSSVVFFNLAVDEALQYGEVTVAYKNGGDKGNQIITLDSDYVSKTLQKKKSDSMRFLTDYARTEGGDGFAIYLPKTFTTTQNFKATVARVDDGTGAEGDDYKGVTESEADEAICTHTTFVK